MRSSESLSTGRIAWRGIRDETEILVNLASILFNPRSLVRIFGFVVSTQCHEILSTVQAHDGPTVSSICYISNISND
jgi:hypothetical protein